MKAAQIASMPPSGPRKSHVATAPSTPRLIASAVLVDIPPPFLVGRAGGGWPRLARLSTGSTHRSALLFRLGFAQSLVQFCPILNTELPLCPKTGPATEVSLLLPDRLKTAANALLASKSDCRRLGLQRRRRMPVWLSKLIQDWRVFAPDRAAI